MFKHNNLKVIIINNKMINNRHFKINNNKIKLTKINNFNIIIQVINIHTNKNKKYTLKCKIQFIIC